LKNYDISIYDGDEKLDKPIEIITLQPTDGPLFLNNARTKRTPNKIKAKINKNFKLEKTRKFVNK